MTASTTETFVDGALPTHVSVSENTDAQNVASTWLKSFGQACETANVSGVLDLIWDDGFWRDILPLTWTYRALGGKDGGKSRIKAVLDARLHVAGFKNFEIEGTPLVLQMFPDVSFVQLSFTFANNFGTCSGMARLIPSSGGGWEAFTISTILESLHGVEELQGSLREQSSSGLAETWTAKRESEISFDGKDPEVLIVGAGHSGLGIAARLKVLGVATLIVDKLPRVGDNWRTRYASLRLHDPVWYDHLPFIPFPSTWPVYTPAAKLADWLESYAKAMDINVWNSSTITSSNYHSGEWTIEINRGEKEKRVLKPKHVVWACGLGGGEKLMPTIEEMDKFKGTILHSSEHTSSKDWVDKKVVVVGACTSGHDVSKELVDQGVADVTMVQRSATYIMSMEKGMPMMMHPLYCEGGPPTDVADRMSASMPLAVVKEVHKRVVAHIREADLELLAGLESRGFKLDWGEDDSGFLILAMKRGGGYYFDCGASGYIVEGKIKMKNGSIKSIEEKSIEFEDGTKLDADVILFATGFGDAREGIRRVLGAEVADDTRKLWGLNYEREMHGTYAGSGVPNFWLFFGNLALSRFNSKLLALQIKAQLLGHFTDADRCELQWNESRE